MLAAAITIAIATISLAMALVLWRLWRGPSVPDRVMALDKLYINVAALLILLGIAFNSDLYYEVALLIALIGFIGTIALCKYLTRGDIIE
jgi:multicomponent K+:H+ antiporter subunit F